MSMRFIALVALSVFIGLQAPVPVRAAYEQANKQCPAGGSVGDPCKDVTNGYVTKGHCVYIGWCKADQYKQPPPKGIGSSGSAPPAADTQQAPSGGQVPAPQVTILPSGQTSFTVQITPRSTASDIVQAAYSLAQSVSDSGTSGTGDSIAGGSPRGAGTGLGGLPAASLDDYVRILDLQGSTYLVTPEEILEFGTELRERGDTPVVPDGFDMSALQASLDSAARAQVSESADISASGEGKTTGTGFNDFIQSVLGNTGMGTVLTRIFRGNSDASAQGGASGALAEANGQTYTGGSTFEYVHVVDADGSGLPSGESSAGGQDPTKRIGALAGRPRTPGDAWDLIKDNALTSIFLLCALLIGIAAASHYIRKFLYPQEPIQTS